MPLASNLLEQAASELIARRKSGQPGPRLPEPCRPADLEDGWQLQQQVTRRLGLPIGGWKAALPSPGKLVVAPIYAPTISSAAICSLPFVMDTDSVNVEPELAFILNDALPVRAHAYTEAEVDAAVGSVHAALEICASRYNNPAELAFPELLGDGLVNGGLWLGPALATTALTDVSTFALTWAIENEPAMTVEARHPDGDPRAPLYWLVNFLRARGLGLQSGQAVITGSYAGVLALPSRQRVKFDYGELACFEVEFGA